MELSLGITRLFLMKITLSRCSSTQRKLWGLALLMTSITLLAQLWLPAPLQLHCRLHALTGLPCPGCGASRCGELLLSGHWQAAAHVQPLLFGGAVLFLPLLAYLLPALFLNWPVPRIRLENRKERAQLAAALTLLIVANWAYLIVQRI